jgi:hypothetical protein
MTMEPVHAVPTYDAEYVLEGLAQFYRQFAEASKLQALAASYLAQAQELEDALWAMYSITLDNAIGDALDQIGQILGQQRIGLSDDEYRQFLRAISLALRSTGSPESLMAVARAALATITFSYFEDSAGVLIEPHAPDAFGAALYRVLAIAKNGGVQLEVFDPPTDEADLFTFSSLGLLLQTGDTARGYSDTTQTTGGELTSVLGPDQLPRYPDPDPREGWTPGY